MKRTLADSQIQQIPISLSHRMIRIGTASSLFNMPVTVRASGRMPSARVVSIDQSTNAQIGKHPDAGMRSQATTCIHAVLLFGGGSAYPICSKRVANKLWVLEGMWQRLRRLGNSSYVQEEPVYV